jgi:hypothetical protein
MRRKRTAGIGIIAVDYSHHWNDLPPPEQQVVRDYKSSGRRYGLALFAYDLNELLRTQSSLTHQLQAAVNILDRASRFPPIEPITLSKAVSGVTTIIANQLARHGARCLSCPRAKTGAS